MTYCCSDKCERRTMCAKWEGNAPDGDIIFAENFYSFGRDTISNKGIIETYWRGPLGNYAMFEPIKVPESSKICPLKFLKKDTLSEDFKCVEGGCAWWCSSSKNCAVTSIALNIGD